MKLRTRFAPSPTGFQTIGNLRTVCFAWLLAQNSGGELILRIEDTDRSRLVSGSIKFLIEELAWLGITFTEGPNSEYLKSIAEYTTSSDSFKGDFGPYVQSQRLEIYKKYAEELVEKGFAYYTDFSTSPEDPSQQLYTIRLKIPSDRKLILNDLVKGTIVFDSISLNDPILLKSNGFPSYHLAVVVDDHLMEITHVLRADEWISTTPIHLLLYEAFGWQTPSFAHVPPVLGKSGKKLSKREGAITSKELRDDGFLPEAVLNYLALLGWSPSGVGEAKEVLSVKEMISSFSLADVQRSGAIFDSEKLLWLNGVYLRALGDEQFLNLMLPFLSKAGFNTSYRVSALKDLVPHIKERAKKLSDVEKLIGFFFRQDKTLEFDFTKFTHKGISKQSALNLLKSLGENLLLEPKLSAKSLEDKMKQLLAEHSIKLGAFFPLVRAVTLGEGSELPLFDSLIAIDQELLAQRINSATRMIESYES
jgi:glutamyl-tRNA synthetase